MLWGRDQSHQPPPRLVSYDTQMSLPVTPDVCVCVQSFSGEDVRGDKGRVACLPGGRGVSGPLPPGLVTPAGQDPEPPKDSVPSACPSAVGAGIGGRGQKRGGTLLAESSSGEHWSGENVLLVQA